MVTLLIKDKIEWIAEFDKDAKANFFYLFPIPLSTPSIFEWPVHVGESSRTERDQYTARGCRFIPRNAHPGRENSTGLPKHP